MKRGWWTLVCLCSLWPAGAANLKPGDAVPDVSKSALVPLQHDYAPAFYGDPSLEDLLQPDGLVILHFLSPRAPRHAEFKSYFIAELSALRKAQHSVPYPCLAAAVLPFGEKGREDALTMLQVEREGKDRTRPWANGPAIYYEPTWPNPGLYHTFRPDDPQPETPVTYLLGPNRKVLAVRQEGEGGGLYDWLQANLPEQLELPVGVPVGQDGLATGPQTWPTFRGDLRRRATAPLMTDRLPYTYLAWQTNVGHTFSSPAVSGEVVYETSLNEVVTALRLDNGEVLGDFGEAGTYWSSPAVSDKLVYAVNAAGAVLALDRTSLAQIWRTPLGALVTASPVLSGGAIYLGARDGAVYALDAANGHQLWRTQTGGAVSSSAAVADGTVLVGSGDRRLYALNAADGQVKWSALTGGPVDSSPTVAGDLVLAGSFDGALYAFNLSDGARKWRCALGGWVHSSPAVASGMVYAATVKVADDQVPTFNWLDLKTGERKARYELPDSVYSSPTIWGGLVLVGCRDQKLYAFDATGQQTQPAWAWPTRGFVHASPVVVGDTVLVASYDGRLSALRQAKPIRVWQDGDVVPRWFMAALATQLHQQTGALAVQAAGGAVGGEFTLAPFEPLLGQIKAAVAKPDNAPSVLPRDVPTEHPGVQYIGYALTAGLLSGYPDATFRPSEPTTRYQFAAALGAVLDTVTRPEFVWRALRERQGEQVAVEVKVNQLSGRRTTMPSDVGDGHWAYRSLSELVSKGLLVTDDEGRFRGDRLMTVSDAQKQWDRLVEAIRVTRTK